jgi:hypothetical protein
LDEERRWRMRKKRRSSWTLIQILALGLTTRDR